MMTLAVPHNISDLSITFFAGGRPFEVQKSHKGFDVVRSMLLGWNQQARTQVDIDALIALADPKVELMAASGGRLEFQGNEIVYGGEPLHNTWVDKILAFKDGGEPFDPIFLALQDLQNNPTKAARERLPIFVERSKLGFLPDGRIAAFKGVRDNFKDVHSNTVLYAIGTHVSMDRAACNANPDQTCTTGLHVGAIDYIRDNGYGWGSDRRMLLTAFWPRDVVAVPTDYRGGKMRVSALDVLDEVDRKFVDELLNNGQTIVRGYEPKSDISTAPVGATVQTGEPWQIAKAGDWILVENDDDLEDGDYLVTQVFENVTGDDPRVEVKTGSGSSDVSEVDNDSVMEILTEAPAWFRAKIGDYVVTSDDDTPRRVFEIEEGSFHPSDSRLKVELFDSQDWVANEDVEKISDAPPAVWMRVVEDDVITISGHAFIRDGEYTVYGFDSYASNDASGKILTITAGDDEFEIRNDLVQSIKREVEEAVAAGTAAAASVSAAPAPVSDKPIWEQVLKGDRILVEGDSSVDDGEYVVHETDYDLKGGPDVAGVYVVDEGYIYNRAVKKILERDGKPYGVTPLVVAPVVDTPAVDTRPVWEQAQIGDVVLVEGSRWVRDGEHTVGELFRDKNDSYAFRSEEQRYRIEKTAIKSIVRRKGGAPVVATDTRPLWKQAKVGDTIKIRGYSRFVDGDYLVDQVDNSNGMDRRLRVVNTGQRWVDNDYVAAIAKAA